MSRHGRAANDRGAILPLVLVMIVIGTLIILPLLVYVSTVLRAGKVSIAKTEALEFAEGALWTTINTPDVFEACGAGTPIEDPFATVSVSCVVLDTVTRSEPSTIPFDVALVQRGATLPSGAGGNHYLNPGDASTFADWITSPGIAPSAQAGSVWLPPLPVRPVGDGDITKRLGAGFENPGYTSCRLFFPGTYTQQIDIDEPAYFVSGVYYFTEPIILRDGADVVVGEDPKEKGCTGDQIAIFEVDNPPVTSNNTGAGGTFVFGENGRIIIDDAGVQPIRFVMNQREVGPADSGVESTKNVSIMTVNGDYAPFEVGRAVGDDFLVDGVLAVPVSETASGGAASSAGYGPSELTPKPAAPASPTDVAVVVARIGTSAALTVTWTAPNNNGAVVDQYTATASTGQSCTTVAPVETTAIVQRSCTITGVPDGSSPTVTVTARNPLGASAPSAPSTATAPIDVSTLASIAAPEAPQNLDVAIPQRYADGIVVDWDPPNNDGGSPIVGYTVTATPSAPNDLGLLPVDCEAAWNETSCALLIADGLSPVGRYDIEVEAAQYGGNVSAPATKATVIVALLGSDPLPPRTLDVADLRVPDPVLDFTTTNSARVRVDIAGLVSTPQGRIEITATPGHDTRVVLKGGVVAGEVSTDAAVSPTPALLRYDNPIAQKLVKITATTTDSPTVTGEAIVQINRSGSTAINSWLVQ